MAVQGPRDPITKRQGPNLSQTTELMGTHGRNDTNSIETEENL